jgi:hypothetical protein
MPLQQIIDDRYIDRKRLVHLLRKRFGEKNFEIRVGATVAEADLGSLKRSPLANLPQLSLNRWILSVPRRLTEVGVHSSSISKSLMEDRTRSISAV